MLRSGLCLCRWRLLPSIRTRSRGCPRALPSTPQVSKARHGLRSLGWKVCVRQLRREWKASGFLRAALHLDRWWPRATCPGAAGETVPERPGAHLPGAQPADPKGPHRCVLRSLVAAGEAGPREIGGLCLAPPPNPAPLPFVTCKPEAVVNQSQVRAVTGGHSLSHGLEEEGRGVDVHRKRWKESGKVRS